VKVRRSFDGSLEVVVRPRKRVTLQVSRHQDRGKEYELSESGFALATFDQEEAEAVALLLVEALGWEVKR
jgi:hypothetical protein